MIVLSKVFHEGLVVTSCVDDFEPYVSTRPVCLSLSSFVQYFFFMHQSPMDCVGPDHPYVQYKKDHIRPARQNRIGNHDRPCVAIFLPDWLGLWSTRQLRLLQHLFFPLLFRLVFFFRRAKAFRRGTDKQGIPSIRCMSKFWIMWPRLARYNVVRLALLEASRVDVF